MIRRKKPRDEDTDLNSTAIPIQEKDQKNVQNNANICQRFFSRVSHQFSSLRKLQGAALLWRLALIAILLYAFTFIMFRILITSTPIPLDQFKAEASVSIVVNTFQRREMLMKALEYYSQCSAVADIHVIWHEPSKPPLIHSNEYEGKVTLHEFPENSLNNRFVPLDTLSEAIFSIDDDIRVDCENVYMLHEVWETSQDSIVGFVPRSHSEYTVWEIDEKGEPRPRTKYLYNCFWRVWLYSEYSMVLSKVAMFHKRFMHVYTEQTPSRVREFVDEGKNCEDIAFQFAVSNATGLPPVYVRGHYSDQGGVNGLSAHSGHWDRRSECLDVLAGIYGRMPLVNSHYIVVPASWGLYLKPSFWYEYFATDWLRRLIGV